MQQSTRPLSTLFALAFGIFQLAPVVFADDEPLQLLREIKVEDGHLQWVAFSPDGKHVASCGDSYVSMYAVASGQLVRRFSGHSQDIFRFAFSPDGKLVASGSRDKTVHIWEVATGKRIQVLKAHTDRIIGVNFSADSKWLASASANYDGSIRVWDCSTWKEVAKTEAPRNTNAMFVSFSPDGKSLATSEYRGGVRVYDFTGSLLRIRWQDKHDNGEMTPHVTFSPDGKLLLTSSWDKTLRCWDAKTGKLVWKASAPPYARCFETSVYSPDGATVYSVTRDETIEIREAKTGQLRDSFRWYDEGVRGLAISPNGKLLATTGHSGKIKVWQIRKR